MKKIFFCFIIITSFFVGCKKDYSSIDKPVKIPNLKTMPNDSLLGNRVKTMIIGLLELSVDSNFVSIVNYEVSKQFDDDDNVMLSTLVDVSNENNIDLIALMDQSVNSYENDLPNAEHSFDYYNSLSGQTNISNIINGFEIDEINYYLQIYIPFADQVNLQDTPIICFGHQEIETTIGYKLNSDNSISVFEVDEEFAENNLIWIVSVNESVNKNGVFEKPLNLTNVETLGQIKTIGRKCIIDSVMIDDTKESWIKGKAEVSVAAAVLYSYCGYRLALPLGVLVKIGKNNLNVWKPIYPVNANTAIFASGWPYDVLADSERITLELYEKDIYGARTHTPCTGVTLTYWSQNAPYGSITYNASSLPNSNTETSTKITSWSNKGIKVRSRSWN